jgi:hypothetical protein
MVKRLPGVFPTLAITRPQASVNEDAFDGGGSGEWQC